jgi:PAS domain S-box-containing protein
MSVEDKMSYDVGQKYQMFVEYATDAFFQIDKSGDIITVNEKACLLTGYSRPELLKMNIRELFTADTLAAKPLRYDLLVSNEKIVTERDILIKSGEARTVEMNSNRMPDNTFQSFFRDITDRKKAEKALIASEHKYRELHNSMMDGFVLVNMEGFIVDTNQSFQEMVGYSFSELLKLTYSDLTPACWHTIEARIVNEQILPHGHSEVYQKEYRRKDGTVFPVELRSFLMRSDSGENTGIWAIARDITDRKRAEEAVKASEEKFRSIVHSSPTAMYFYHLEPDNRLVLTGANPAADQIIGLSHTALIGMSIEEAFPNLAETNIPDMYRSVARGELGHQTFEVAYDDPRFKGFYSVSAFRTGEGTIAVDFVDISERKQVEELHQRSAEQKEILLREIHHRVKNNLAIVISLLNFQLRRNDDPELARMIRDIQLRIRSMALIHEHLYQSDNLDRIPLSSYVQSLSSIILSAFSGQRVRLSVHLEPIDVSIETALPIGLILNELLTNAFKYAFPDGKEGMIEITLKKEKTDHCTLSVSDNGIGLPGNFAFDSDKSIGMYIVKLLAEQLDGHVEIDQLADSVKTGTTFRVLFRNIISKTKNSYLH